MATKAKQRKIPKGDRSTCTLVGLPGVKAKSVQSINVSSITDAMKWIRGGWCVNAAGDNGSVVVWRDDGGTLRAEFCRYRFPLSEESFFTYKGASEWLREWWPKMEL